MAVLPYVLEIIMERKTGIFLYSIFIGLALAAVLFAVQSCSSDQPSYLGISALDLHPSWSPDGTRIVFCSLRDTEFKIYTMNADGSSKTRLTDNPAGDFDPSWSPDGERIAFVSKRDGNEEIYIMNTDGSNQIRLTDNPAYKWRPSWSPDGQKIAYESAISGNWYIFVMNADGSNQTRLTSGSAWGRHPDWSPDGTRIAYQSYRASTGDIYVMNADGSNPTKLTDNAVSDGYPSWSPDGSKIAFSSDRDRNWNIYVMNADGTNPIKLTDHPADDTQASWSPDGKKIAFVSERDFDGEVYVMDADGSNPINLTNNAPIDATFGSVPLPQSELDLDEIPYKIVFESFRETDGKENWEICLIDADGSDFVNLTNTAEIDEMYPHASPDGRLICFVADEGEDLESKRRNVYTMNIDGTNRVKIAENAYQPCWSGDGKRIAYLPGEFSRYNPSMRANKGLEIYDLETGEAKRHPNDKIIHIVRLCWSPDGKWFVGVRPPPSENAFKADDKTMMRLSMLGCTPDISPDGKLLVWNGDDWHLNIGTLDFDSPQNSVTDHRVVVACEHEYWIYHADWSPDGNYLTFSYAPWDGGNGVSRPAPGSNICIFDLRTGKWTQITTDGKHYKEPDWVPVRSPRP